MTDLVCNGSYRPCMLRHTCTYSTHKENPLFRLILSDPFKGGWFGFWNPISGFFALPSDCGSKFHFFSIIMYIHTTQNSSALVWFRSGEKPKTSSQKLVLHKMQISWKFPRPIWKQRYTLCLSRAKDFNDTKHLCVRKQFRCYECKRGFHRCSAPYGSFWMGHCIGVACWSTTIWLSLWAIRFGLPDHI